MRQRMLWTSATPLPLLGALLLSLVAVPTTARVAVSADGGKCAVPGEKCVCRPVSQCNRCDEFEMAVDREMDDPDWCSETGYKRRVHCIFTNDGAEEKLPQDTYESCSVASIDRVKYFSFEATCAVVGAVFVFGANKRKALLYERIERRLKQQIEDVDVDVF